MLKLIKWGCSLFIVVALVLGGVAYYIFCMDDELQIDQTPNVVTSIKQIAELSSMNYYEEFDLTSSKASAIVDNTVGSKISNLLGVEKTDIAEDEIVIIAKGHVRAGFNLTKMEEQDIRIKGDTLLLTLPQAEILDLTINPSDFEMFVENGSWSHEEVQALEKQALTELEQKAQEVDILKKAEENGISELQQMYKAFGFSKVICKIKK